jgi:hypothetical protein
MPDRSPLQRNLDRWFPTFLHYFGPVFALMEFFIDDGQHPEAYILAATAFGYKLVRGANGNGGGSDNRGK